jgi:hypothetical protein
VTDREAEIVEKLGRVRGYVENFGANLPIEVDVAALGVMEKAPFIAMCLRASLIWRVEEQARNAVAALERGDQSTGIVLARCVTEGAAMMWRLRSLVEKRGGRPPSSLHEDLSRMWLGSKNDPAMPQAFNILTMIDHLDREIPNVRQSYDMLSEAAHPNWTGVAGLYCQTDYEQHIGRFGRGLRGDHNAVAAAGLLLGALGLFQHAYNGFGEVLPIWLAELTPIWGDDVNSG